MLSADQLKDHLGDWDLGPPFELRPISGGINSQVWLVEARGGKFVAKVAHESQLLPGLEVASFLNAAGFASGAPLPNAASGTALPLPGGLALAVLRSVPGRALERSRDDDRALIARTLGRSHALLAKLEPPKALPRWPWRWLVEFDATTLPSSVTAAITRAVREAEALVPQLHLTQAVLHGDVAGRDFILDELTGDVGLVDWGASMFGPLLYDVGSFCALARLDREQRERFLDSYLTESPLRPHELAGLDAFVRLRWAVQARYFGWRIARNVKTGISDDRENQEGFRDALEALGLSGASARRSL